MKRESDIMGELNNMPDLDLDFLAQVDNAFDDPSINYDDVLLKNHQPQPFLRDAIKDAVIRKDSETTNCQKKVDCGCLNVLEQEFDASGNLVFASCDNLGTGMNNMDVHYQYQNGKLASSERILKIQGKAVEKVIIEYGQHQNVTKITRESI